MGLINAQALDAREISRNEVFFKSLGLLHSARVIYYEVMLLPHPYFA
jgi:hypothetical protein